MEESGFSLNLLSLMTSSTSCSVKSTTCRFDKACTAYITWLGTSFTLFLQWITARNNVSSASASDLSNSWNHSFKGKLCIHFSNASFRSASSIDWSCLYSGLYSIVFSLIAFKKARILLHILFILSEADWLLLLLNFVLAFASSVLRSENTLSG